MTHPIEAPAKETLSYSLPELAVATGISRSEIYVDIAAGKLTTFRRGTRQYVEADEAKRWIRSHNEEPDKKDNDQ
ncbi:hypothetical protein [Leifsonia sp. TF02-11]|uniref:hypothetical protein n=1 Tax=Leifsonia sp. TF02-11 TaxID=2815212 RepID=UPI001AA104B9|nr:hypothetical protein [Leifsonia sp. TF02-11]MBO1739709.1 hypothetical protein [Leifsonia sp. TF02-11]